MMKRLARYGLLSLVALILGTDVVQAATIAHWSFDASSLSHDGNGDIVGAADSTGNHNATLGSGVGSASVANGGPTFNSNTIPGSNSVAGQFGQALTLSGFNNNAGGRGQFLEFPNLTELMTANSAPGAPSYTVSMWLKTTTPNQHQFTVLSDWGNAGANPGRFTYGFGFNVTGGATPTAQMRGQSRNNITGAGNGQDIFARPVSTATLNNGNWHMLTWTFDTTTGKLRSYFDGALVDTFQSTASGGFNMIASSSAVGTFGLKGDTGNFVNGSYTVDEVWVVPRLMRGAGIQQLFLLNAIPEPGAVVMAGVAGGLGILIASRRRLG
jgi:concanavalin A-like lectin/glucanase superfamily protein